MPSDNNHKPKLVNSPFTVERNSMGSRHPKTPVDSNRPVLYISSGEWGKKKLKITTLHIFSYDLTQLYIVILS